MELLSKLFALHYELPPHASSTGNSEWRVHSLRIQVIWLQVKFLFKVRHVFLHRGMRAPENVIRKVASAGNIVSH